MATHVSAATQLYVAPEGTGSSCSLDKPCSLETAQQTVRSLTNNMKRDIVVNLRGGRYVFADDPMVFRPSDSGQNGHQVIYQAYRNEKPILEAGVPIDGWVHEGKNIYSAPSDGLEFRQLYVNDKRGIRAREPNTGYLSYKRWVDTTDDNHKESVEMQAAKAAPLDGLSNSDLKRVEMVSNVSFFQVRHFVDSVSKPYNHWQNEVLMSKGGKLVLAGDWAPGYGPGTVRHVGDFNGDNKDDLLLCKKHKGRWQNQVFLSNGTRFLDNKDWAPGWGSSTVRSVGDFNGDGKDDVLLCYKENKKWRNRVLLSTGRSFRFSGDWAPNWGASTVRSVGDFNGDGKDDVLLCYKQTKKWRNRVLLSTGRSFRHSGDWAPGWGSSVVRNVGDFNGDGKDDVLLCYKTRDGIWRNRVLQSTGRSFKFAGDWINRWGAGQVRNTGDFNGDGKDDVLLCYKSQDNVWRNRVLQSTGTSFKYAGDWLNGWGKGTVRNAGDFNGDGLTDILLSYPTVQRTVKPHYSLRKRWRRHQRYTNYSFFYENAKKWVDTDWEWYLDTDEERVYLKIPPTVNINTLEIYAPRAQTILSFVGGCRTNACATPNYVHDIEIRGLSIQHTGWNEPSQLRGFWQRYGGLRHSIQDLPEIWKIEKGGPHEIHKVHPAAVELYFSRNIRFEKNLFQHLGANGINYHEGTRNNKIIGNVFHELSDTAIVIGTAQDPNPDPGRENANETIRNNFFHRMGMDYYGAMAIWASYPRRIDISHNEIYDSPNLGINIGWNNHDCDGPGGPTVRDVSINYNIIANIAWLYDDTGGIHIKNCAPNSQIIGNWIKDMRRVRTIPVGTNWSNGAIYLDNEAEGYLVRHNVMNNVDTAKPKICNGRQLWGNASHTIRLNTCKPNTFMDNDGNGQGIKDNAGLQPQYEEIRRWVNFSY